jgi:hypothetical protein
MPLNINISSTIKLCCENWNQSYYFQSPTRTKSSRTINFCQTPRLKCVADTIARSLFSSSKNTRWNLRNTWTRRNTFSPRYFQINVVLPSYVGWRDRGFIGKTHVGKSPQQLKHLRLLHFHIAYVCIYPKLYTGFIYMVLNTIVASGNPL